MIELQRAISIAEQEMPEGCKITKIYECESFWAFYNSRVKNSPIGYAPTGVMKDDGTTFRADPRFYSLENAKKILISKKK